MDEESQVRGCYNIAQRTSFNTLDNWGHKTPTQSKRKGQERKVKGSQPETHKYINTHKYTRLHMHQKKKKITHALKEKKKDLVNTVASDMTKIMTS